MTEQVLFLSLRPEYAELLMSGDKTVELRRIRPRAAAGTQVMIYASSPQREVIGTCVVEEVGEATPDEIWRLHGQCTGITKTTFREYFAGSTRAIAITVRQPKRLRKPIPLEDIRTQWINFQPPQSFRYIDEEEASQMLKTAPVGRRRLTA